MQWHVHRGSLRRLDARELLHGCAAPVRSKLRLPPYPFRTFSGDRALGELVFQPNLKLGPMKPPLPAGLRNVKFAGSFCDPVRRLLGNERWRGEDELQGLNGFQLSPQSFESINREAGRCDSHLGAGAHSPLQIVTQQPRHVV